MENSIERYPPFLGYIMAYAVVELSSFSKVGYTGTNATKELTRRIKKKLGLLGKELPNEEDLSLARAMAEVIGKTTAQEYPVKDLRRDLSNIVNRLEGISSEIERSQTSIGLCPQEDPEKTKALKKEAWDLSEVCHLLRARIPMEPWVRRW